MGMGEGARLAMLRVATNMLSTKGMASNFRLYHSKYIQTGSFQPIMHTLVGMFAIGYGLEHVHLKHAEDERLKASTASEVFIHDQHEACHMSSRAVESCLRAKIGWVR